MEFIEFIKSKKHCYQSERYDIRKYQKLEHTIADIPKDKLL
jgi:hypothetical protein